MCRFCKLNDTELNEQVGYSMILSIKDGTQIFELFLNRYICNDKNIHKQQLILDQSVNCIDGSNYPVKSKQINIKYCPFCGEKL